MKFKTIKEKIFAVVLPVIIISMTATVSASADDTKTYLKNLPYPDIVSNIKEEKVKEYSFTEYDGNFNTGYYSINGTVECNNAMLLKYDDYRSDYKNDALYPEYKITYNLNKEFTRFHSDIFTSNYNSVIDFEISDDNNRLLKRSISNKSAIVNADLDVTNVENLVITVTSGFGYGSSEIVFNNSYVTKSTVPIEEPTEKITEILEEPTEKVTEIIEEPTEKITEIVEEPTEVATTITTETVTQATEPATKTEQSTNATQIPTSIPTSVTTITPKTDNNNSNNSTTASSGKVVNTGETYIMIVIVSSAVMVVLLAAILLKKRKYTR